MHDTILQSNLDSLLVAIPFIFILLVVYFRLDEVYASSKKQKTVKHRPPCGVDEDGETILTDPDGRRWSAAPTLH